MVEVLAFRSPLSKLYDNTKAHLLSKLYQRLLLQNNIQIQSLTPTNGSIGIRPWMRSPDGNSDVASGRRLLYRWRRGSQGSQIPEVDPWCLLQASFHWSIAVK